MEYSRFIPNPLLRHLVDCYWIVEGRDTSVQKVIPDGCTELIFHFGDPYMIQTVDMPPQVQSLQIAAGQLDKPVYLQPTGRSGVFGIKFHPAGIWKMFRCDMHLLTNRTFDLADVLGKDFNSLSNQIREKQTLPDRIGVVEHYLINRLSLVKASSDIDILVDVIQNTKGQVSIDSLARDHRISSRKLERLFRQRVGISAKSYARLTRFAHVYQLLQQPALSKVDAIYLAGYFDQPHFNKEFREFTGENPENYFSHNHGLSNFFLRR